MNRKLKIALKPHSSEQGFALPVALGMGLIMVLVGTTMLIRGQGDQVTASAQKATSRSLAIAEGGLARTLANLNKTNPNNSSLLKRTYDPNGLLGSAVNEWTGAYLPPCYTASNFVTGTIDDSTYTVLAYRYANPDLAPNTGDETGTLLVEGNPTSAPSESKSRVQQTFKVVGKAGSLPGVLGEKDIALGNNDVLGTNGNVACTDTTRCPVSCPVTTQSTRAAIGAGPQSNIDGEIFISGTIDLPAVPLTPPTWNGTTIRTIANFPDGITTNLGNLNGNNQTLKFPRATDIATHIPGTPYNYSISSMQGNGYDVTINTKVNSTKNPTGDPVYFYVSGDIDMGGSSQVTHPVTEPGNHSVDFRIYGSPTLSNPSQIILVASGASGLDGFIFAPKARIGINGTGTINGLVWGLSFGEIGANGNATVNVPPINSVIDPLGDLAIYLTNSPGPVTNWKKVGS